MRFKGVITNGMYTDVKSSRMWSGISTTIDRVMETSDHNVPNLSTPSV